MRADGRADPKTGKYMTGFFERGESVAQLFFLRRDGPAGDGDADIGRAGLDDDVVVFLFLLALRTDQEKVKDDDQDGERRELNQKGGGGGHFGRRGGFHEVCEHGQLVQHGSVAPFKKKYSAYKGGLVKVSTSIIQAFRA